MAYWEWGDPTANHAVLCVHGLTRQGRDFDALAQALVVQSGGTVRVLCPDIAGRGQSDWLADPAHYQLPQYVGDVFALVRHLGLTSLDWVGTSMGGLIGLGAIPHLPGIGCSVRRLVLNDVGVELALPALQRIAAYVGQVPEFDSLTQALDYLRRIASGFGPHTPAQWQALNLHGLKPLPAGRWALRYDPTIGHNFSSVNAQSVAAGEQLLWAAYDAITADTLLLRGADSDLLTREAAIRMGQRGPRARLHEFTGVGHAPTLVAAEQYQVVVDHLL